MNAAARGFRREKPKRCRLESPEIRKLQNGRSVLTCSLPVDHDGPHMALAESGERLACWRDEDEMVTWRSACPARHGIDSKCPDCPDF